MFRSKKKKVGTRKRREAEAEGDEAESDLQMLAELRRSRSRVSATAKGSMSFSSKRTSTGLLSFDDGEGKSASKRRKMRPNLVASSAAEVEIRVESTGQYSAEMLASLRSEQSVLLPSKQLESNEQEDVEMSKNRVTFGVQSGASSLPKTAEVIEEVSAEEDEDEEQNRRWEEELMRRGGHRAPLKPEGKASRSRDGLPTYPTRRKVACVSLGSVLGKLEKSLESTSFEDERASRELARLEAETALIEATLKQQQEELLVSSEEFEYFQEVEDFVKGLSFCLREKVKVITAKEKNVVEERVQRVGSKRHEEMHGVALDVQFYLEAGRLQRAQVVSIDQLDLHANDHTMDYSQRSVRLQKYQQHFAESYVPSPCGPGVDEDLFADAIDEINSLEPVYGRFQEWKAKFPEVHKSTYCELAQEKLFAPYVQAELMYWDPLGVADAKTELGKSWSLDDFAWFRLLHQHIRDTSRDNERVNGPLLYQIRDVLLEKVRVAVTSYFDPYSSLQARSLALVLEEISRHDYTPHVEGVVKTLVTTALNSFSSEAKRSVLIAIDQNTAATFEDVSVLARYQSERFNALQDNLLTLFIALPRGKIAAAAFRCLLQVLHHLLAYVRHCQDTQMMHLVPTATQVVRQLSGSSYLLQILSDPDQENELKHMMELFAPYLQTAGQ
ncbi:hypothetical protein PHYSODRAFT_473244 [Phytophthora sojae]|uniref:GCF C-terminal domain-containing protein n=1 Tax=Phytophthora sojae (strain P6497) TaxID=1094619 RepID=G4YII1_PHYSP|nr:hypothetical protein PHYSODRAFT_473244 [Phytophthora sojae]EGZ27784.1 hypothetical protein PHYSODRAFT_473244 [Phytophthora sojae]|eukprot:XP_009515059.1 hypothetical protein PHYSODRAFT_473244 [Phytophthora sojae]